MWVTTKKVIVFDFLENISLYVALGRYSDSKSPEFIIHHVFPDGVISHMFCVISEKMLYYEHFLKIK